MPSQAPEPASRKTSPVGQVLMCIEPPWVAIE